jgi:hypothetical protein
MSFYKTDGHPTKPHKWVKNDYDGGVDDWAFSEGEFHNGPRCEECDYGFCHHCYPEGYATECGAADLPTASDSELDPSMVALDRSVRARFSR